jgi:hypothetical protein
MFPVLKAGFSPPYLIIASAGAKMKTAQVMTWADWKAETACDEVIFSPG